MQLEQQEIQAPPETQAQPAQLVKQAPQAKPAKQVKQAKPDKLDKQAPLAKPDKLDKQAPLAKPAKQATLDKQDKLVPPAQ